jgi:hypothetical protein
MEGYLHLFSLILNAINTHGKRRWQFGALVPAGAPRARPCSTAGVSQGKQFGD